MFSFLRHLFCFHAWEYEIDTDGKWFKECRKCEKTEDTK